MNSSLSLFLSLHEEGGEKLNLEISQHDISTPPPCDDTKPHGARAISPDLTLSPDLQICIVTLLPPTL